MLKEMPIKRSNLIVALVILFTIFSMDVTADSNSILAELRAKLASIHSNEKDPVIPYLCQMFPSKMFINAADDEDLLSSILYELGFGLLGIQANSWAERLKAKSHKDSSCFASLYSIATSDTDKSTLAHSRRIIHRCCQTAIEL